MGSFPQITAKAAMDKQGSDGSHVLECRQRLDGWMDLLKGYDYMLFSATAEPNGRR